MKLQLNGIMDLPVADDQHNSQVLQMLSGRCIVMQVQLTASKTIHTCPTTVQDYMSANKAFRAPILNKAVTMKFRKKGMKVSRSYL